MGAINQETDINIFVGAEARRATVFRNMNNITQIVSLRYKLLASYGILLEID